MSLCTPVYRRRSKIERGALKCADNRFSRAGRYVVTLKYPDSNTLRPSHFKAKIRLAPTPFVTVPVSTIIKVKMRNSVVNDKGRAVANGFYSLALSTC